MTTLAFDIYGTLIDTNGVTVSLQKIVQERAQEFSRVWREKQLEYSFRRGLMRHYVDFSVCTRHALDYTCSYLGEELSEVDRQNLMKSYKTLPAFADVKSGLDKLQQAGIAMYGFSNGTSQMVEELLENAGIRQYLEGVVSVEDLRSYKPDPAVYCHFLRTSGATREKAWMISSNPFDVIGAKSAGMQAAWVRRNESVVFDPWEIEADQVISSIAEISDIL